MRAKMFLALSIMAIPSAALAVVCAKYSLPEIADAVRNSPNSSETMKNNACMWAGAAMAESGGNSCSDNDNNYGVLQLTRTNLPPGMSPETYKHLSLQEQVDIWAQFGGPEQQGAGYNTLIQNVGGTINGVQITQGMIAACSQFGGLICTANLRFIQQNGRCQSVGDGGVRATNATLRDRTATLDGNSQSICSWGDVIQARIDNSGCSTTVATCGPGDFPDTRATAIASAPPPPSATDILVKDGQV
jgi:hypothetical protein